MNRTGYLCTVSLSLLALSAALAGPPDTCMTPLSIDGDTLLDRVRQMGVTLHDFPSGAKAAAIDGAAHRPVEGFVVPSGESVFWVDAQGQILVDQRFFSDLQTADVLRLSQGESTTVGTLSPAAGLSHAQAAELLMRAGLILTFAHLGSELCLEAKDTVVQVTGTHTYYTNEKNVDPVAFSIAFDKTGKISVAGG